MAHFRGTVKGNRASASRLGSKKSGLVVECNGWHAGVIVRAIYDERTKKDQFLVYSTGGSNGSRESKLIEVVKE